MCTYSFFFLFIFQAISFNQDRGEGGDIHQGFHLLFAEITKTDTQHLLRTAKSLFGEKSYDFLQ
jgi:hypothetical protein